VKGERQQPLTLHLTEPKQEFGHAPTQNISNHGHHAAIAWRDYPYAERCEAMGVETALLFCAIRAAETMGTVSFARDTRAGYEIAWCLKREEFSYGLLNLCLTSPALILDATLHPARFGSVASCFTGAFEKASPNVHNKDQDRLHADEQ